jgi:hypothetical protein
MEGNNTALLFIIPQIFHLIIADSVALNLDADSVALNLDAVQWH